MGVGVAVEYRIEWMPGLYTKITGIGYRLNTMQNCQMWDVRPYEMNCKLELSMRASKMHPVSNNSLFV